MYTFARIASDYNAVPLK